MVGTIFAAVLAMWIVCDPNCRQADPYASGQPTPAPTAAPTAIPPATPAPTARPTAVPTAQPTAVPGSYPLTEGQAAGMVVAMPEQIAANVTPNHTVPTAQQLQQVQSMGSWFVGGNGIPKVTGNYTGTTDQILQWGAYRWGFTPDLVRAIAVDESHWKQLAMGDLGRGVSLSILQIKSTSWQGTCPGAAGATLPNDPALLSPNCLSHNNTAFGADYKLAVQRNCVDGRGPEWFARAVPTGGKVPYKIGQQNDLMGCVGAWFSGTWQDAGSLSYQATVASYLLSKPWKSWPAIPGTLAAPEALSLEPNPEGARAPYAPQ